MTSPWAYQNKITGLYQVEMKTEFWVGLLKQRRASRFLTLSLSCLGETPDPHSSKFLPWLLQPSPLWLSVITPQPPHFHSEICCLNPLPLPPLWHPSIPLHWLRLHTCIQHKLIISFKSSIALPPPPPPFSHQFACDIQSSTTTTILYPLSSKGLISFALSPWTPPTPGTLSPNICNAAFLLSNTAWRCTCFKRSLAICPNNTSMLTTYSFLLLWLVPHFPLFFPFVKFQIESSLE